MKSRFLGGRSFAAIFALLVAGWSALALANGIDSIPLQPGAKVVRAGTATMMGGGAASDVVLLRRGTLIVDFDVPAGNELGISLMTDEQWQALSSGRQPSGSPLTAFVSGIGTRSLTLEKGHYHLVFTSSGQRGWTYSYRLSLRE